MKKRVYLLCLCIVILVIGIGLYTAQQIGVFGAANMQHIREDTEPRLMRELADKGLHYGNPVFIRIFKASSELELWVAQKNENFTLFRTYPICAYSGQLGPKLREGDRQAPEGFYTVTLSQLNPNSRYHLAFNLGFPNAYDKAHGRTGSYLMVHGNCVSIGCYAMTDALIEEIYLLTEAALLQGQQAVPVHIFPFRMEEKHMEQYAGSQWIDFWRNLKEGYDAFESSHMPPKITVTDGRYIIQAIP